MIINCFLLSASLAFSVFADSIILENDCKRTTEECFIRLETLKGDPSRDCSIFSTIDRKCSIKTEVPKDQSHLDGSQLITITETDRGTVVSWHGENNSTKGGGSTSLSAMSVWDRILPPQPIAKVKRSTEGVQTECVCKPVQRQKRNEAPRVGSVRQFQSQLTHAAPLEVKEAKGDPCNDGYRFASKYIGHDDTSVTRQITAGSLSNCAKFCKLEFMHKATTCSLSRVHNDKENLENVYKNYENPVFPSHSIPLPSQKTLKTVYFAQKPRPLPKEDSKCLKNVN